MVDNPPKDKITTGKEKGRKEEEEIVSFSDANPGGRSRFEKSGGIFYYIRHNEDKY